MDIAEPQIQDSRESIESSLDELLHQATSLQSREPEQAFDLAVQAMEIAKQNQLHFHHAWAEKVLGNIHLLKKHTSIAIEHYHSALIPAQKTDNLKLLGDLSYNLGHSHLKLQDHRQALHYLHKSLSYRIDSCDKMDESRCLNEIGQVYWDMQQYADAVDQFQKAATACDSSVSAKQKAMIYNNLGNALIKIEEFPRAMEAYVYSLKLKETFGGAADLAVANLNLGSLYFTTMEYTSSLSYYQEALSLYVRADDKTGEAIVQSNLGAIYAALGQLDQAETNHQKALEYFKQHDMIENYARSLNSIGNIHFHKSEYLQAIDAYRRSVELKSSLSKPESLAITYNNLSECYFCLGDYHAALDHTQISLQHASSTQNKTMLLKNYCQLGKIFAALKDFANAYEALNSHRLLDLEIYQDDKKAVMADMMAHYEADQKSREIETLKSDRHTLEALFSQQVEDKMRYLKLYRSKREEVKKRQAAQAKLTQLNAELEMKIDAALQNFQAQQQIILQKSKLESLGVMAAGMAHEINQPLSAITMSINNLVIKARKKELSESYLDDKIRKIMDDIQRIRNVIEHVRLFSRDQINSKPERIDIYQTLKDAIHLISYDLGKHQIKLRMPQDESTLITVGSKFKLEQVFLNLLTNARDAILERTGRFGSDAREPLIKIDTTVLEGTVEIAICDNGTGMSEQCIARIFDPFYTSKSPEKGTGLGLSISYGIIREMGGQILVSSEPGETTIITVVLPILEEQKWQS